MTARPSALVLCPDSRRGELSAVQQGQCEIHSRLTAALCNRAAEFDTILVASGREWMEKIAGDCPTDFIHPIPSQPGQQVSAIPEVKARKKRSAPPVVVEADQSDSGRIVAYRRGKGFLMPLLRATYSGAVLIVLVPADRPDDWNTRGLAHCFGLQPSTTPGVSPRAQMNPLFATAEPYKNHRLTQIVHRATSLKEWPVTFGIDTPVAVNGGTRRLSWGNTVWWNFIQEFDDTLTGRLLPIFDVEDIYTAEVHAWPGHRDLRDRALSAAFFSGPGGVLVVPDTAPLSFWLDVTSHATDDARSEAEPLPPPASREASDLPLAANAASSTGKTYTLSPDCTVLTRISTGKVVARLTNPNAILALKTLLERNACSSDRPITKKDWCEAVWTKVKPPEKWPQEYRPIYFFRIREGGKTITSPVYRAVIRRNASGGLYWLEL